MDPLRKKNMVAVDPEVGASGFPTSGNVKILFIEDHPLNWVIHKKR